ncbi:protein kinase [Streptomyces sp. HNM0574]|uniref:protein kinase domain-containing protein n=1 Tax=Streptomyces sp. HNM0574 TaxID=2714954 RepID=UPI00146F5C4A|nr:protein kinase [Streptomyces sp. HNM0574]NLU70456.1 protein kinase [Streptomyces sp. HNM0574]
MTGRGEGAHAVVVPAGYRVGGWEVGEPLASGGFASVYRARRAGGGGGSLPEEAALKFLPTGTRTPRQLRHLQDLARRELEIHRRLRRPRLIRMYEALTVDDPGRPALDGATVLVLERAEVSLDKVLARTGPRPLAGGPRLLAQVCEGIAQLHRAGWVHGDLKPGNVLLMPDGTVRLGDFNLAAEMEGTHGYAPAFASPDYTPPELLWGELDARGRQVRPSVDVWAFGVVAHLVLTGVSPLPGATAAARREALASYAQGLCELRLSPELPTAWREIVTDCLARTHEERAAHEVGSLLRRVESAAGTGRSPRLPRLRPRRGGRRRLALGSALLTAAVGVGGSLVAADGRFSGSEAPAGFERCSRGNVCFFSGKDGRGEVCNWWDNERDWLSGRVVCGWGAENPPRSVFNNGYTEDEPYHDVLFYREADYRGRIGCVPAGERRNLSGAGDVVRSLEWERSCAP